jgi:hypothetical protein
MLQDFQFLRTQIKENEDTDLAQNNIAYLKK